MENKVNSIMLGVWGILVILTSITLFVFVHEAVHVFQVDTEELMCIGFGDGRLGFVQHYTQLSENEISEMEFVANLIAFVVTFVYMMLAKNLYK